MATALYRRYRPETFSEMIGQAQVTEPLMTALRTARIGHAYLFSGPRGCGKTTSARILARCLNCAEGPTDTPCGTCESCVELGRDGGGSLDVVEIDAASHGGVDDARELRERAVFAPARDRYKIFIIDEAHMVTSGGFNALLKIVEEPPPHVKFVFATTEPEKVIGTIRSRTHHYPFRLIAPGTLIDYVQQLCESEGIEVEQGVLPLVVRAGGGSVRDTLSILDQLIAGSEAARVTLERATGLLGFTSGELLDEVVGAFASGDAAAAFAATDRVVQTGQDPRRFVEDLLERLRDLIVISATSVEGASAVFRGVPGDQLQHMFEQAQAFPRGLLSRLADTVGEALDRMTGATAPRLHLELMVARALVVAQRAAGASEPPAPVASSAPARPAATAAPVAAAAAQKPATASPAPAVPAPGVSAVPEPVPPSASNAAPAESGPAESGADVIAAMRSARDFLNQEAAPLTASPLAPPAAPAVGFAELTEAWPEVLQELLENDRDAWIAVKDVRLLALDGALLTVGLASRSDLEVFKSAGAGPLRETIEGALGVTVKYRARSLPAESAESAVPEAPPAPPEATPAPPEVTSTEPASVAPASVAPDEPLSEPPAPAWAEPASSEPTGPAEPAEPAEPSEPVEQAEPGEPSEESTPETSASAEPAPSESGPGPAAAAAAPAPITGRYGEAVVREVLSARFVEERPLPEQGEA